MNIPGEIVLLDTALAVLIVAGALGMAMVGGYVVGMMLECGGDNW